MIYLVTLQHSLFENKDYKVITVAESLDILNSWNMIQYDSETLEKDCHVGTLLLVQFGSIDKSIQILVDCTTIDIRLFKVILETKYLIGQN